MNRYSLYSLMFVFIGASMQASQLQLQKLSSSSSSHGVKQSTQHELMYPLLEPSAPEAELSQLSSLAEPSRYIADPSQISRPYSPSRSLIAASSSIKTVQQEEEKAQSSMPSIQDTVAAPKVIKYPLSDEIMHKAKRLEAEKEIKVDCLAMYGYLQKNPSVIQDQIRAHAPQLSHYFVQFYTPFIQKESVPILSKIVIAHHDANNRWFKEQKEQDEFALTLQRYVESEKNGDGKLAQDLVQKLKNSCLLNANKKMWFEVYPQLDDAQISIKEQLASIVSDPEELKQLVEEEFKKVAFIIVKDSALKYYPKSPQAKDEAAYKVYFDEEYTKYQTHIPARQLAQETEAKKIAEKAKYCELAAAKQARKDKKCVIQ